jgi:hypothetical protein
VKKIAEYIKVDLSGTFKLTDNRLICFRYVCFIEDYNSNYYGWSLSDRKNNIIYYFCCKTCLRPSLYCRHNTMKIQRNGIKDISSYHNQFKFDNPIKIE